MIEFQKYHACGNNFIIIRDQNYINDDYQQLAIEMCNYNTGIGADGLIIVKTNPLEMVFYNQDGTRGSMCGNGIRSFAKYVLDNIYPNLNHLSIITLAGMIEIDVLQKDPILFRVNMGTPKYDKKTIGLKEEYNLIEKITFKNKDYDLYNLFMGVTHTVVFVENLNEIIKTSLGEYICYHPMFIDRTNVDFVEIISKNEIKMKTYERGVGWTLACGTGSCAAFITGLNLNLLNDQIKVYFEIGEVKLEKQNNNVILYSGAEKICTGQYVKK